MLPYRHYRRAFDVLVLTPALGMDYRYRETYKETSTDRSADRNHLKVARLHLLLQERVRCTDEFGRSVTVNDETPACQRCHG